MNRKKMIRNLSLIVLGLALYMWLRGAAFTDMGFYRRWEAQQNFGPAERVVMWQENGQHHYVGQWNGMGLYLQSRRRYLGLLHKNGFTGYLISQEKGQGELSFWSAWSSNGKEYEVSFAGMVMDERITQVECYIRNTEENDILERVTAQLHEGCFAASIPAPRTYSFVVEVRGLDARGNILYDTAHPYGGG